MELKQRTPEEREVYYVDKIIKLESEVKDLKENSIDNGEYTKGLERAKIKLIKELTKEQTKVDCLLNTNDSFKVKLLGLETQVKELKEKLSACVIYIEKSKPTKRGGA